MSRRCLSKRPFRTVALSPRPSLEGELGDVVAPGIENNGAAVRKVFAVAANQIEIGLDRGRREQGVYHRRRMAGFAFHASGDGAPATYDRVFEGQDASGEPRFERVAGRDVPSDVAIVGGHIGDALVIFAERENAEEKARSLTARAHCLTLGAPCASISEPMTLVSRSQPLTIRLLVRDRVRGLGPDFQERGFRESRRGEPCRAPQASSVRGPRCRRWRR